MEMVLPLGKIVMMETRLWDSDGSSSTCAATSCLYWMMDTVLEMEPIGLIQMAVGHFKHIVT